MPATESVAVFWDYENCAVPTNVSGSIIANNIRRIAHQYGGVKTFKAYMELPEQSSPKSYALRSELQLCGVSLIDCPHNGGKDVADKMMIVDMMAYAIDTQAPATIILISGDRDFVYAVSVLCLRQYRLVVLAPHAAHASLKAQASVVYHWPADVLPDEPSPDVAKPRSTTIPDYFRTRSDPLSSTAARLAHPVPASPPMSPAAPRRPIPTSAPSDSALLRPPEPSWMTSDGSPPLVSNLGLPISSGTPASDTTAVDPAAEGRTFLTPSNGQSDYFNDPYQQPSPSPSPKRSSWASIAKLDSTQLSADAPTFTSQLQDNPFNPFAFPSTSTSTSTPAPAPAPIPGKRAVAAHFRPLVKVLRQRLREGVQQVPYSELGTLLRQECASVYEQAGVTKLKEYANLAEEAQVALLTENVYGPGGVDGQRWVSLHPRLVKGAGQKAALKALDEWTLMTRQGVTK